MKKTLFGLEDKALCIECLKQIDYKIEMLDEKVLMKKYCDIHGLQEVDLCANVGFWKSMQSAYFDGVIRDIDKRKNPYMVIVETNDECDIECPTCIASSKKGDGNYRDVNQLVDRVIALKKRIGSIPLLMISGGEPTLHPDIMLILKKVKNHAEQVMLITNGIKISEDEDFVKGLSELGNGFQVYLQFDSLQKNALILLRGNDYRGVRIGALKNLKKHAIPVTLICVVKRGVNDNEVSDIVRFAQTYSNIKGVTFQPIRSSGRHHEFLYEHHSVTNSEIRDRLLHELSWPAESLAPHPVNPFRICIGYFYKENDVLNPITEKVYADVGSICKSTLKKLYLTEEELKKATNAQDFFRVAIISYLDKYDYTLLMEKCGGVFFLMDNGELMSMDYRFLSKINEQKKEEEMDSENTYSVVMTTTQNEIKAEELAKKILAEKLAACIQIQNIKSYYTWKNEVCVDPECLLLIKTKGALFAELEAFIKKNHSYETPEIIQLGIKDGSKEYLRWISDVTES